MTAKRSYLFSSVKLAILSFLFLLHFSAYSSEADSVRSQFSHVITNINQTLTLKQQAFSSTPELLAQFIDTSLLPVWSSEKTLKGLLGKKIWQNLSNNEKKHLVEAFNNTLQRYVQEGFSYYDGQQIDLVDVKLNSRQTKGLITVRLTPKILPSFDIHFKINLIADKWYLYDVLVKGISYISLKKDSYRQMVNSKGVAGFLNVVNSKNEGYQSSRVIK